MSLSDSTINFNFYNYLAQFFKRSITLIADLRLAIILLLIIALFSVSGTVIEQNQSPSFYQENYPEDPALFGFLTAQLLLNFGLDHVYTTWWFLAILFLFGMSLTACTFRRQIPALKSSKIWQYYQKPREFNKLAFSTEITDKSLDKVQLLLREKGYKINRENNYLYAQKGITGRIGPIIVHLAMIIILLGAIWGAFTGFFAQELIPDGETNSIQNIFSAGKLTNFEQTKNLAIKVNDFWIDYTEEGKVDQFYSDLSILNKQGEELKRKTIFVNEPLRYHGITFYQTSWDISAIKIKLNNSPIFQLPMVALPTEGKGKIWGTFIPTKSDLSEGVSLIAKDLQGTMFIYSMEGNLISAIRPQISIPVNGVNLTVVELVGATGLQIKSDPGVPFVYLGFGLLMVGVIMSYVSFSQVWALQEGDRLFIGGKTNRAQVAFEREMITLIE